MANQPVKFLDYTGGMQNATSRFMQKDNEMDLCINGHGDIVGAIKKRFGFKQAGTAAAEANKNPAVIHDGGHYCYTHLDTDIYYNAGTTNSLAGAWTATSGGSNPAATTIVNAANFEDLKETYFVGGTANASADGDFMTTQVVANESGAPQTKANADTEQFPKAKFVCRWRDRLYFSYCSATWFEGAEVKTTRTVYTEVPAAGVLYIQRDENDAIVHLDHSDFTHLFDTDEPITGQLPTVSSLVIFTRSGMWDWTLSSWRKRYNIGCVSSKTIKSVDVYNIWLSERGIEVESDGKPQLISNKIQPIIDAIPDKTACFSWVDDSHYYMWVGTLTLDGISYQNCVIQYSIKSNAFYIYKYRLPYSSGTTEYIMKCAGEYDDGTCKRAYFGASDGCIYYLSNPADTTKIYTDGDQTNKTFDIELKIQTKRWDFGAPDKRKKFIPDMTVLTKYASNLNIRSRMEGKNWKKIGGVSEPIETFPINPSEGRDIQLEFSQIGKTEGPEIQGVIFNIEQSEA
jgi:hypothetical protein